jgi:hypothetical protein
MRESSLVYYTDDAASDTSATLYIVCGQIVMLHKVLSAEDTMRLSISPILVELLILPGCLCRSFKQLYIQ